MEATRDGVAIRLRNNVAEVTLCFWVVEIMATTVGETAADFPNTNPHARRTNASLPLNALPIAALVVQVRARQSVPPLYWIAGVPVSVVGTPIADAIADHLGNALVTLAHCASKLNAVRPFSNADLLTRPLGASFGDLLPQPSTSGGLGPGTVGTSALFLTAITTPFAYMTAARRRVEAITLR